jgi:hypothetical protein
MASVQVEIGWLSGAMMGERGQGAAEVRRTAISVHLLHRARISSRRQMLRNGLDAFQRQNLPILQRLSGLVEDQTAFLF